MIWRILLAIDNAIVFENHHVLLLNCFFLFDAYVKFKLLFRCSFVVRIFTFVIIFSITLFVLTCCDCCLVVRCKFFTYQMWSLMNLYGTDWVVWRCWRTLVIHVPKKLMKESGLWYVDLRTGTCITIHSYDIKYYVWLLKLWWLPYLVYLRCAYFIKEIIFIKLYTIIVYNIIRYCTQLYAINLIMIESHDEWILPN